LKIQKLLNQKTKTSRQSRTFPIHNLLSKLLIFPLKTKPNNLLLWFQLKICFTESTIKLNENQNVFIESNIKQQNSPSPKLLNNSKTFNKTFKKRQSK